MLYGRLLIMYLYAHFKCFPETKWAGQLSQSGNFCSADFITSILIDDFTFLQNKGGSINGFYVIKRTPVIQTNGKRVRRERDQTHNAGH